MRCKVTDENEASRNGTNVCIFVDMYLCIWYDIYMENNKDFTINSDLTYGRGYVYSLQYHLVWCTKYRKKVLRDGIDTECREMLTALAEEYKFVHEASGAEEGTLGRSPVESLLLRCDCK